RFVPGDTVDAVGFAAAGEYTSFLHGATVRKLEPGPPPRPLPITPTDALSGHYHFQLVRVDASLLDQVAIAGEQVFTLRAGKHPFSAVLEDDQETAALTRL